MKLKYIICFLLISAFCLSLVSCNTGDASGNESTNEAVTEKIKYIYETKHLDCAFLSYSQKEAWRDALVSLLNNKKAPVYDDGGDLIGETCLYPDRPCIENGYDLALFDINVDGTPELLVNMGGGSAGNAFYMVYDIMTGREIGNLDGGHGNSWCIYFNRTSGKYEAIGQFQWRIGWNGRERYVNKAVITNTVDCKDDMVYETNLMYTYYSIDAVNIELTEEMIENGCVSAHDEICNGVSFRVNGSRAYIDEYFDAQDDFTENYIRIAETGIVLIDWDDVSSDADDVLTRAEKMAQALISSDQSFLAPLPEQKGE